MSKGKIFITILLIIVLLAASSGAVYYFGFHDREQIEQEQTDNTDIVKALQRIITLLENGIEGQSSINEGITSRFGELSERIDTDREDIDGIISELDDIFATLFFLEQEIEALESYDDTAILSLYDTVMGSLSNLIKDKDILTISHSDLVKFYEGLQTVVNGLIDDVDNMDLDLGAVKTDLQATMQAVIGLQSGYSAISVSLNNAFTLIGTINTDFDIFRTDFTELDNTVAEILVALSLLDDGGSMELFLELQADITDIQNRLNQYDSTLQALTDTVNGIQSNLGGRITNIENAIAALEMTVSLLGTDIIAIENKLELFDTTLQAMSAILDSIISDGTDLSDRVSYLENEISILQERIQDLENGGVQKSRPIELLSEPLIYNPYDYEDNIIVIPDEIVEQLADRDIFRVTGGAFAEGLFIVRVLELHLFFFEDYPAIVAVDTVSFFGIEILLILMFGEQDGEYILQFAGEVSHYEIWELVEIRIFSVEYIKGAYAE